MWSMVEEGSRGILKRSEVECEVELVGMGG